MLGVGLINMDMHKKSHAKVSMIFAVNTEVHKRRETSQARAEENGQNTWDGCALPFLLFLYLANEVSGKGNITPINTSNNNGIISLEDKAEGKSPVISCTKHDTYRVQQK